MKHESASERRAEPRRAASGTVQLKPSRPLGECFQATLLDVSKQGFRARHDNLGMASGDLVAFAFEDRQGLAQAMWTRILDGEVETGFCITSSADA